MFSDFTQDLNLWQVLILALVSLGVGVLGGFVGLALGTMRLPAMLLIGLSPPIAAGTNILVSTLSSMVGGYRHLREGRVDWRIVAYFGIPSVAGAFAGGFVGSWAPEGALVLLAGLFVSWQSVEFLIRLRGATLAGAVALSASATTAQLPTSLRGLLQAGLGLIVGLVGGAVGLILGSVRLPIIIRVIRADPRIAAGSNLVIGSFLGLAGFVGHGVKGELDGTILLAMAVPAVVGTYLGARLTGRVSLNGLILTMSLVLFVIGILLIVDGVRRWVGD